MGIWRIYANNESLRRKSPSTITSSFRFVDAVAHSGFEYSSNENRTVPVIDMPKREMMKEPTTLAIETDNKE